MEVNLVTESLKFLVLGMSTVFLFLLLMIYILKLQAFVIQKFFSKKEEIKVDKNTLISQDEIDDNSQIIAAITAAIADFRKNQ